MKAQTKRTSSPRVECLEGRALLSSVSGVIPDFLDLSPPMPVGQVALNLTRVVTSTAQSNTFGNIVSTPGGY